MTAPADELKFTCAVSDSHCIDSSPACHRAGRCLHGVPADEKSTQAENELIAERLLGWERLDSFTWRNPHGSFNGDPLPTFTTWHERGLIIDALHRRGAREALSEIGKAMMAGNLEMTVVRSAALSYLRSLER